jgi:3-oxoacyl-[acyl-carrier-protein] synthase II
VRYALLRELQALDGYQGSDLTLPDDDAILAALEQMVPVKPSRPRRVVITGIGAVTPVGNTAPETWKSFVEGRSGVTRVTQFDPDAYASQVGAELKNFDPTSRIPHKEARRMARCSQVALIAAYEAAEDSGLDFGQVDGSRVGVVMGTGLGGIDLYSQMIRKTVASGAIKMRGRPLETINGLPNMPAFHISNTFGCRGPLNTIVTACAAGTQAIGHATEEIRRGVADIMFAGGVEALIIDLFFAGFEAMRATTTRNDDPEKASRPFDAERDGFVIGEGSAVFVLEALESALARGARIYAEVLGWSESADAFHIAQPDPEGRGAAQAMRAALADAALTPSDISYINAHAAGTPLGDARETIAIKEVFGPLAYNIPISATKSMIGHLFGGAGAAEALACVYSVYTDVVHPTINYTTPDPECDLDYVPNEARAVPVHAALSNSFGLGGQNACLVVGKYQPPGTQRPAN